MRRRSERALLVTAIGVGLAGAALVAVARGATLDQGLVEGPPLTLPRILFIWLQVGAAAFACHALLIWRRPQCDQVLLPTSLALNAIGLAIIFSLDPAAAQKQVGWLWVALTILMLTVLFAPEPEQIARHKYLLGLLTAALLVLPMLIGREINGARLWIKVGPATLQPGELAKITLVLFLAGYLSERAELIAEQRRRIGPFEVPDPQFLAPLILMWALGMMMLVRLKDLGTALLFFGTFVALVYLATARAGYLVTGAISFVGGAYVCARLFRHVRLRLNVWLDPWSSIDRGGYQVAQGLFAIAAGGVGGTGLGLGAAATIPAVTTDFPFAAVCEELGLWGAAVLVALYLVWVGRAFRIAAAQPDRLRSLLAAGLGCLLATQTLVIMGGVTKLIPLTGITLPFVSYGGSSLVTNYLMLGLLLRASEGSR